jgi:hypothetical protein
MHCLALPDDSVGKRPERQQPANCLVAWVYLQKIAFLFPPNRVPVEYKDIGKTGIIHI